MSPVGPALDVGGDASKLLLKLMSASALRGRVIANNIANLDVPGFQRQVVRFEDLLHEELASGGEAELLSVEPRVETDTRSPAGPDGNNVSLELETNAARENRLQFELYATILQSRMDLVSDAITRSR